MVCGPPSWLLWWSCGCSWLHGLRASGLRAGHEHLTTRPSRPPAPGRAWRRSPSERSRLGRRLPPAAPYPLRPQRYSVSSSSRRRFRMVPAPPMLRIDPALPMERIEPVLPMLKIEPALPMLRTDPKLKILPMLNALRRLDGLRKPREPVRSPGLLDTTRLISSPFHEPILDPSRR